MSHSIIRRSLACGTATAAAIAFVGSAAFAKPAPEHIRGTIAGFAGNTLEIKTADHGTVKVVLAQSARVAGVVHGKEADITAGTFIGTANVPDGSSSRALEVVVFPPSMKGTGEGDYAWDLPGGGGTSHASTMTNGTVGGMQHGSTMTNGTVGGMSHGSTMTNGTVGGMSHGSTMTNGTVASSSGSGAKTVSVNYGSGTRKVTIAPNTPVVRIMPATRSALKNGAHVFVVASGPAGAKTAGVVIVGEDGVVPPM